jgi:hypothetical protein
MSNNLRLTTSREGLWLFFLPFFIVVSCATLSPVDGKPERPVTAARPEEVIPNWQILAAGKGGIAWFAGKTVEPKLQFWALRIDLDDPELRIVVRDGAVAHNGTGALSTKVSSFVRDNRLLAGINATPFDTSSAKEGENRINAGIVVSDGVLLSPPDSRYHALVWFEGSGPAIVPQSGLEGAKISEAAGGFHQILKDRQLTGRALNSRPRYARSAAGLASADLSAAGIAANTLYLLVIDGNRPGSIGATEAETALLLRALGAQDGINLDGGGSSALALRYSDGRTRVVNTPMHGGIPGRERAVAACLGVGFKNNLGVMK